MLSAVDFHTHARRFEEAYQSMMRPLTEQLGMAQPAVDILLFLANNPGLDTAKEVCLYRHLKPAIVSFHVENLAREGYLERQAVPEDRRKCRLVLTAKAQPVIRQGRAVQELFSRRLTEGLTAAELETCLRCFAVMGENMTRMAANRERRMKTDKGDRT